MAEQHTDVVERNYVAQEVNIANMVSEKEQRLFHIKNKDCAIYRLMAEPLKQLDLFLEPGKSWLTVADYNGLEANYLLGMGQNVVASDLSDALLREANAEGLIKEYSKQNVERLTFGNGSFDYVMCKEAFHHFPRAYLALYEMIRVSRIATIMVTEPIDILSKMSVLMFIKNILDKIDPFLINRFWKNRFSWEIVGNYVFKISEREIEKIAMGIGLPCIAFKHYTNYASHQQVDGLLDVPLNKKVYGTIKRKLALRSFISSIGIVPHGSVCTILFKEQPNETLKQALKNQGFVTLQLPPNPYLK